MPYRNVFPSPSVVMCNVCGYYYWNCWTCTETQGTGCYKEAQKNVKIDDKQPTDEKDINSISDKTILSSS